MQNDRKTDVIWEECHLGRATLHSGPSGAARASETSYSSSHPRKVHVRLPGKGNSNSHGARPVRLIITMIKWIRTSRLSIKNSLSLTWMIPGVSRSSHVTFRSWTAPRSLWCVNPGPSTLHSQPYPHTHKIETPYAKWQMTNNK